MSLPNPVNLAPATYGQNNGVGTGIDMSNIVDGIAGGKGTKYNGTDEFTNVGNVNKVLDDLTLSAFINYKVAHKGGIISNAITASSKTGYNFFLWDDTAFGEIYVDIGNGTTYKRVIHILPRVGLHHVGITLIGNVITLYANGDMAGTPQSFDGSYVSPNQDTEIGRIYSSVTRFFAGIIDEIFILKTGLSQIQMRDLYEQIRMGRL